MKVEYAWKLFIVCGFIIARVTSTALRTNCGGARATSGPSVPPPLGGMVIMAGAGVVLAMAATAGTIASGAGVVWGTPTVVVTITSDVGGGRGWAGGGGGGWRRMLTRKPACFPLYNPNEGIKL
ncbi:unnamed protein product [Prunus armeniaca]